MKNIGLLKAMRQCRQYKGMNESEKQQLKNDRLREIVYWAMENSPYYKMLYKDVKKNFKLTDLPTVNKRQLMSNWNDWVTDSDINLSSVYDFMKDLDNIGLKFKNKYMIFTTSGSTGEPLVSLCDKTTNNVMSAINVERSFARSQDMKNFIKRGGKSIGVFATGGFYLANGSVAARQKSMPWKKNKIGVTSALLPVEQIVNELNKFKPAMLGGYPSNLELLIDEAKSGRLNIYPVIIMTGGEYLSEELRKKLSETFNCYVQTSYSCTEGGTVACECAQRHFHINDDWIIVEPVDINNMPVEDGKLADKYLLTNLFNYTQPFIRYEISDRIVMHHEQCECGNTSPWITVEGRTDDVVELKNGNGVVKIAPMSIYATLKEVHSLLRFQVLVHDTNKIELRLIPVDGVSFDDAFELAKAKLLKFLSMYGATEVEICPSPKLPKQHEKSGKFKHIINMSK